MSVFLAIILFISFTIGLNLGLHGVIVLNNRQNVVDTHSPTSVLEPQSWQQSHISHPKPAIIESKSSSSEPISRPILRESDKVHVEQQDQQQRKFEPIDSNSVSVSDPFASSKDMLGSEEETKVWEKIQLVDQSVQQLAQQRMDTFTSLSGKYANSPLVLLTCNRPQLLDETLKSALQVRGVTKDKILIVQDGNMKQIQDVAQRYSIQLIQNQQGLRLRGGAGDDGASRIAQHYKFALSSAFDHFKDSNAIVIIEDDLLFAPDFYEYLTTTAQVLDADPSTFVVSAWSDNGFKGKVHDPYAIRRTDFFPGLGWILTKQLYKNELEDAWPREHWDHWLRSSAVHKNRETVFPQVPRTFHNGIKGTFMNVETHNRYFKDIALNQDATVSWEGSVQQLTVMEDIYEQRVEGLIKHCKHVKNINELAAFTNEILCIWIDVAHDAPYNPPPFQPIANFFGIWHEHKRGNHRGLHEFYWEENYVLLLNVYNDRSRDSSKTYRHLMPPSTKIMTPNSFDRKLLASRNAKKVAKDHIYKALSVDQSCDEVCRKEGKTCLEEELEYLNNCVILQEYFPCTECKGSQGPEQPAYVRADAPTSLSPGSCLFNMDTKSLQIKCNAHHYSTYRLCSCK